MNRRAFLGILAGTVAAPIIARPGILMPISIRNPILWADGIHDDAPAIQRMIDDAAAKGERFAMHDWPRLTLKSPVKLHGDVSFLNCRFDVSTFAFRAFDPEMIGAKGARTLIKDCEISAPWFDGGPVRTFQAQLEGRAWLDQEGKSHIALGPLPTIFKFEPNYG